MQFKPINRMHRHLAFLSLLIPLSFFVFCDVNCLPSQAQENLGINKVATFKVLKTKDGIELATIRKANIPRPIIQYLPGENSSTVLVADFPGLIWELPTKSVDWRSFGIANGITSIRAGRFQDSPPICRISVSSRNSALLSSIAFKSTPGRLVVKIPQSKNSSLSSSAPEIVPRLAPPLGKTTPQKAGIAPPLSAIDPNLAGFQGPQGAMLSPEVISQSSTVNGLSLKGAPLPGAPDFAPEIKSKVKHPVKAPPRNSEPKPAIAKIENTETGNNQKSEQNNSMGKLMNKWKDKTAKLLLPNSDVSTMAPTDDSNPPEIAGQPETVGSRIPPVLTFDRQALVLTGFKTAASRISYSSFRLSNPDRFVIDFADLPELSESSKPDLTDNKFIRDIRFGSVEANLNDNVSAKGRLVFDLLDANTAFNINADSSKITISVNSNPNNLPVDIPELKGRTIVLDAGHGGTDPGAQRGNYNEKDITLSVVKYLSGLLQARGVDVILTRSDDTFISLAQRVDLTNKSNPDAFVSVHVNAMESSADINGLETYYQTEQSEELAGSIHKNLLETLQISDRNIRKAKFYVINRTEVPSVLAEIGFISNQDEREKLVSSDYQKQVAEGLAKGIILYLSSSSNLKDAISRTGSEKRKIVSNNTISSPKKDSRTAKLENEKIGAGNLSNLSRLVRKGLGIGMGLNKEQAHR